jgi:hypothetical protein
MEKLCMHGLVEALGEYSEAPDGEEDEREAGARNVVYRITGAGVLALMEASFNANDQPPAPLAGRSHEAGRRVGGSREPPGRDVERAELAALFAACDPATNAGARDAALLALLYGAGLRRSEAIGLARPGRPLHRPPADARQGEQGAGGEEAMGIKVLVVAPGKPAEKQEIEPELDVFPEDRRRVHRAGVVGSRPRPGRDLLRSRCAT